jgi:hypothetical protein
MRSGPDTLRRASCVAPGDPFKHDIKLQRRPQTNTVVIIHNRDIRQLRSNRSTGLERTRALVLKLTQRPRDAT